ncbi:MAG: hypothetical protein ACU84J_12390 [Gammaproteobacteria bacterium]
MLGIVKSIVAVCLFLAYPYLVYRGISEGLVWLAPSIFAGIYLWQAVKARRVGIRIYKASVTVGLMLGTYFLQSFTAKVMPVFIQLMLIYFFGRTLLKAKGPSLIERFVRLEFPEFPPGVSEYCRQLTWLWTLFFAFNAVSCTVLALWGSDFWWTLFNGIIIYLMIGLLMIGEYIYRHFRFPDLWIPDPKSTIKTMIVNGRKIWLDIQAR